MLQRVPDVCPDESLDRRPRRDRRGGSVHHPPPRISVDLPRPRGGVLPVMDDKVNLAAALASFDEAFQPRIVGAIDVERQGTVNTGDAEASDLTAPERPL